MITGLRPRYWEIINALNEITNQMECDWSLLELNEFDCTCLFLVCVCVCVFLAPGQVLEEREEERLAMTF